LFFTQLGASAGLSEHRLQAAALEALCPSASWHLGVSVNTINTTQKNAQTDVSTVVYVAVRRVMTWTKRRMVKYRAAEANGSGCCRVTSGGVSGVAYLGFFGVNFA
jgi:hypothetical protein